MPISLLIAAILVLLLVISWRWIDSWLSFRGERVVTCPENERPAGVRLDAVHAAAEWFAGRRPLRLNACSRWPELAGCGQECPREIERSPENCLVRNIVAQWYAGKSCAWCGTPIGAISWGPSQPALIRADKDSVEWKQVPANLLLETLEAAVPICFPCHMANRLVREHPELATPRDRPPK